MGGIAQNCLQISDVPCHTEIVATQTIVILDFGSQYTQLIARRIREQNVFSVVLPCTAPLAEIKALQPLGLILSGGPSSVYDADAPAADPKLLDLGVPVLGICYGLHFIVHHLGGKVRSGDQARVWPRRSDHRRRRIAALCRAAATLAVWMSHGDEALELPAGFHRIAFPPTRWRESKMPSAASGPCSSIPRCITRRWGRNIIKNFLFKSAARAATGPRRTLSNPRSLRSARRSAGTRHLRPLRRRGFVSGGGAGASGHRKPN
jgi:GMP synthase (glutamine-hydrolysing)